MDARAGQAHDAATGNDGPLCAGHPAPPTLCSRGRGRGRRRGIYLHETMPRRRQPPPLRRVGRWGNHAARRRRCGPRHAVP